MGRSCACWVHGEQYCYSLESWIHKHEQHHHASFVIAPATGNRHNPTLQRDAVVVDAIINTIGFPLVGGPAGTMEGGRQAEVARAILQVKNIPYVVAAPLLIQVCGLGCVYGWVGLCVWVGGTYVCEGGTVCMGVGDVWHDCILPG